jgi:hypothetical protein
MIFLPAVLCSNSIIIIIIIIDESTVCEISGREREEEEQSKPRGQRLYCHRFGKRSRLGQRHGLQSTTLTSYFYENIC